MGTIRPADVKMLWGRAANRCTFCRCELAHEGAASGPHPIGEQAHIVAESVDGPRGLSDLPLDQRSTYPNLILLCPTCHTKIDKAPEDYPVDVLLRCKAEHEAWVRKALGPRDEDPAETRPFDPRLLVAVRREVERLQGKAHEINLLALQEPYTDALLARFDPGILEHLIRETLTALADHTMAVRDLGELLSEVKEADRFADGAGAAVGEDHLHAILALMRRNAIAVRHAASNCLLSLDWVVQHS